MKNIKKFLDSDLFMFVLLLAFAPLGILLMWKRRRFNKSFRVAVSILSIILMFGFMNQTGATDSYKDFSSPNNKLEQNIQSNNEESKDKNQVAKEASLDENSSNDEKYDEDVFAGYKLIEVDGGNLSGHREPNVVVDIGFGDREYYAFTNEYGQLVRVIAKEIILQNDKTEPVTSSGRYYPDEAKVPGVESKNLDEGHVIADSLGGVSNAYNITPQNSTLNRHGDQAYMEKAIREAGGCTDFEAIITYPNTTTQIPSHYSYTYTIRGNVIKDSFENINPDKYNDKLGITKPSKKPSKKPVENQSSNSNVNSNNYNTVYWTPNGKSYHTTRGCPTLSRSKTVLSGTIQQSGKSDPCDRCH